MPKVLIGVPVSEMHAYAIEELVKSLEKIMYPRTDILFVENSPTDKFYNYLKEKYPNVPIVRGYYSHEKIRKKMVECKNFLREKVLKEGYDYLLALDQDTIPPQDVLERLLSFKKEFISGVYFGYPHNEGFNLTQKNIVKIDEKKATILTPIVWVSHLKDPKKVRYLAVEELKPERLIEAFLVGSGCILLSKKFLEKIKFRYVEKNTNYDDYWLCEDARENGYKVYVFTGCICKHLILKREWQWERIENK
ncbi:glycosyltransferase family 2 protein [Candidatus Woesearchaeota archaeon]|nr:glycosyltransferase family 2 protein [Candidatus Woesearchaeota archaeon]